jgi:type II secretory pathway pseudopilin PulG
MEKIRTSLIGVTVAAIVALAAFPTVSAALQSAALASCLRNQLGVRANGINGAAGTIHGAWVFTNVSAKACDLDGYPDIQLYGRRGRPIPTTVKRNLPPAPSLVKLLPGGSATFYSSYSDVSSGPGTCPTSAVIQITPPNATGSLFIPAKLQACRGVVHVSAVRAGVHPA